MDGLQVNDKGYHRCQVVEEIILLCGHLFPLMVVVTELEPFEIIHVAPRPVSDGVPEEVTFVR